MNKLIIAACVAVALGGCSRTQTLAQDDDAICQSMGAWPDTDAYVACRLQQLARKDALHDGIRMVHPASKTDNPRPLTAMPQFSRPAATLAEGSAAFGGDARVGNLERQ